MFKIDGKNSFVCDESEFSGVKKIADKVRLDVERVTGVKPEYLGKASAGSILFATLEQAPLAEKLASDEGLSEDVSKIKGKRESYVFAVHADKIIIIGSDKRGTIYGLFHLSELMGVSPLVDWADVLPAHRDFVELEENVFVSKEPSVRYRGFFINDEWPAYGNWTNHNFGGFNAKMYEHVFELLLRLKGNYLWPAMWSARFSDDGPDLANAELADELGVVMGASHHEPCCRAGEEYRYLRGPDSVYGDAWNFWKNREGITKFWEDGLKRNGKFENVITVGMRGEADTAIMQNATLADNINLLRDVLKTQNNLIRKYVNPDIEKVPRMLALYKEVEPYFYGDKHTKGLMDDPELEGVTLMLCDDNHGNLRTVPTEHMRSHKGGYGMYYHFDYHGSPYSFEWINTTNLAKVKEQMCAAYEFGIRDLWIVNVGDVMTNELPLSYFLDLAYNYDFMSIDESPVSGYIQNWISRQFPTLTADQKNDIDFIINEYTKIAHTRRTECVQPDTYHPVNFGESDMMISRAEEVIARAEKLKKEVPAEVMPAFYSQVYYPACGNMNVLRMQLYSGKNQWYAKLGALVANTYAKKVKECYDYDKALVAEYDTVDNGKFYAMGWSEHFGFRNWCEAFNQYPVYMYVEPTRKKRLVVWIDGEEFATTGQDWTRRDLLLSAFRNPDVKEAGIKLACCNAEGCEYKVEVSKDWVSFRVDNNLEKLGEDAGLHTIIVSIDRAKAAADSEKTAVLKISGDDGHGARILVNVHIDANVPKCDYPRGTFVQTGSYISIEAEHRVLTASTVTDANFRTLPNYGKTLSAIKAFPVINSYPDGKNAPCAEYRFAMEKEGVMAIDFYLNPSNPAYKDNKLQFIAEINGEKLLKNVVDENFAVGDNQEPWSTDVTNNIRISSVYADCKAGLNTLKVYPVTPNIVLEKIVIHEANTKMPESYLGAPETYIAK